MGRNQAVRMSRNPASERPPSAMGRRSAGHHGMMSEYARRRRFPNLTQMAMRENETKSEPAANCHACPLTLRNRMAQYIAGAAYLSIWDVYCRPAEWRSCRPPMAQVRSSQDWETRVSTHVRRPTNCSTGGQHA